MLFNTLREQKAFAAFLSTLLVVGTVSSVAIAKPAHAEIYALAQSELTLQDARAGKVSAATYQFTLPTNIVDSYGDSVAAPSMAAGTQLSLNVQGMTNTAGAPLVLADLVNGDFVTACTGTAGEMQLTGITTGAGSTTIAATVCAGDTIAAGTSHTLTIGDMANSNSKGLVNAGAGSYTYTFLTDGADYYNTVGKMVLVDNVHMSATIDPTLTFTVSGVSNGVVLGAGDTTTATTSSSAIALGTLTTASPSIAAQALAGATNAKGGMAVTVRSAGRFESANGAVIDGMNNGTAITDNVAYAIPAVDVSNDGTWGTIAMRSTSVGAPGMTSDFSSNTNWSGKPFGGHVNGVDIAPANVKVFEYARPIRSTEASTTVVFKTQISDIQEAATDYKTDLIYVATPTF